MLDRLVSKRETAARGGQQHGGPQTELFRSAKARASLFSPTEAPQLQAAHCNGKGRPHALTHTHTHINIY